jgi:molybdopterin-containing oxidoreductase family iron-sulfur binding subunit
MLAESGVPEALFDRMATRLFQAQRPLVLGTSAGAHGANGYATNLAVNLLNLILNPDLPLLAFEQRYRVETAATRATLRQGIGCLREGRCDLFFVHNTNPVYALPPDLEMAAALQDPTVFVVSFSNVMDETTALADLVLPVRLPLESWDAYEGMTGTVGIQQPVLGRLNAAPALGDVLMAAALTSPTAAESYKTYLPQALSQRYGQIDRAQDWIDILRAGGRFATPPAAPPPGDPAPIDPSQVARGFESLAARPKGPVLIAAPSIRYFDGRGANKAWLNEIPDPLTTIAWQSAVLMHPETAADLKVSEGDLVTLKGDGESLAAAVYDWEGVVPGAMVMTAGQGHSGLGRYARNQGANPFQLLGSTSEEDNQPVFMAHPLTAQAAGQSVPLARTAGSRSQHDRKIALHTTLAELRHPAEHHKPGLTMWDFPLTLPLPEGYDTKRDFYPPFDHEGYRWAMVVDLDRCVGCNACAAACYAENNIAVVQEARMAEGREMAWLQIQRYLDEETGTRVIFLPMLCQHCNNAPCEAVCPVYAPHHNAEGLNNQIYNRCIGTRFCSQNCPYKVRRFNWYAWPWPEPLNLQLNPDVTVRSKGVMEKCSFCIQRIKAAHNVAKNEKRAIRDGEVVTACMQTCPTGALTFGSLMDPASRVRRLVDDPRAYQIMGYLNVKPAVIYLKKVVQEV